MAGNRLSRWVAVAAVTGALLLLLGTLLHPMQADPNDPLAAFTEYASNTPWIATHLIQLAGVTIISGALVLLFEIVDWGPARPWAALGLAGAVGSWAVTAALQAVDGVALKAMVDRWSAATGPDRQSLFLATLAVRQIEAGLASMSSLLFGCTVASFGVALLRHPRFQRWSGWLAIIGGIGLLLAGVAMAYTGFSALAMNLSIPATALLLLWLIGLGVQLWRLPAEQHAR
jgi:hypothetical protein